MRKCTQCSERISWWSIFKGIWGASQVITCDNCKKQYSITLLSKVVLFLLTIVLPTFISINIVKGVLGLEGYGFTAFMISGITFALMSPFYIRLKSK